MKLNHEYIKNILLAIESDDDARPYLLNVLKRLELEKVDQNFVFHYEILFDYGFIESTVQEVGIGIKQTGNGDYITINVPIRLTASGHEFIEALNKSEIWEVIKREFAESSVKTIFKIATDLAEGIARKQVKKILNNIN